MIDDLVTRGVAEPYRMFTSRAEYRLTLRADNADQRLTPRGMELGFVGEARAEAFARKMEALAEARSLAETHTLTPQEARAQGIVVSLDGQRRDVAQLLAHEGASFARLAEIWPDLAGLDPTIARQLEIEARYAQYSERQEADVLALRRDAAHPLPPGLRFDEISGLSRELQDKLNRARPDTLAQAGNIEGMTPAALTLLLIHARRASAVQAASR